MTLPKVGDVIKLSWDIVLRTVTSIITVNNDKEIWFDTGTYILESNLINNPNSWVILPKLINWAGWEGEYTIPDFNTEGMPDAPCEHQYKEYVGLIERFEYCVTCDHKRYPST